MSNTPQEQADAKITSQRMLAMHGPDAWWQVKGYAFSFAPGSPGRAFWTSVLEHLKGTAGEEKAL